MSANRPITFHIIYSFETQSTYSPNFINNTLCFSYKIHSFGLYSCSLLPALIILKGGLSPISKKSSNSFGLLPCLCTRPFTGTVLSKFCRNVTGRNRSQQESQVQIRNHKDNFNPRVSEKINQMNLICRIPPI